jgi:hypothetical protein
MNIRIIVQSPVWLSNFSRRMEQACPEIVEDYAIANGNADGIDSLADSVNDMRT